MALAFAMIFTLFLVKMFRPMMWCKIQVCR